MAVRILASALALITALTLTVQPATADTRSERAVPLPPLPPKPAQVVKAAPPSSGLTGKASWYDVRHRASPTTTRTAAHRDLPFGTLVKVTNIRNGRSAVVMVNDRGPHVAGRVIDVSQQAAQDLGMVDAGVADVRLEVVAAN